MKRFCVSAGLFALAMFGGASLAIAFPSYQSAWETIYPNSTLPTRMQATTGATCHICHHPPERFLPGNCYRQDIIDRLLAGRTIFEAIEDIDGVDSDGDGVANGDEIELARTDLPGEVGYNPGLIGETGTDPCAQNPNEAVTGQPETPPDEPCVGDLDGDNDVDFNDLVTLLAAYGVNDNGDVDGDGDTDFNDLVALLGAYGSPC